MTMPQFTADASLGPSIGAYRGSAVFDGSGGGRIAAAAVLPENLVPTIVRWLKPVECCSYGPPPECWTSWVPFWYDCVRYEGPNGFCVLCFPPENRPAI